MTVFPSTSAPAQQPDEQVEVLSQTLEEIGSETVSVSDFVRRMVSRGFLREDVVSRLHREIAAGRIVLTDRFFLARPRT